MKCVGKTWDVPVASALLVVATVAAFWPVLHSKFIRLDDGDLHHAATLWVLPPAWKDVETAWEDLVAGDYDPAHEALEYWPDRVKKARQTNYSFAIAHGLA
jgi:hypothetical protein